MIMIKIIFIIVIVTFTVFEAVSPTTFFALVILFSSSILNIIIFAWLKKFLLKTIKKIILKGDPFVSCGTSLFEYDKMKKLL